MSSVQKVKEFFGLVSYEEDDHDAWGPQWDEDDFAFDDGYGFMSDTAMNS